MQYMTNDSNRVLRKIEKARIEKALTEKKMISGNCIDLGVLQYARKHGKSIADALKELKK